jgi:hypothetical protein
MIKLTFFHNKRPLYLNQDNIVSVFQSLNCNNLVTSVLVTEGIVYEVIESPEDIFKLAEEYKYYWSKETAGHIADSIGFHLGNTTLSVRTTSAERY